MFTDKYIKMCDTPEIQDNWKPEVGDWHNTMLGVECVFTGGLISDESDNFYKTHTFLPLQHQLQEMLRQYFILNDTAYNICTKRYQTDLLLKRFYHYSRAVSECYTESVEEIWLMFVMSRYEKKWDNTKEEWVDALV